MHIFSGLLKCNECGGSMSYRAKYVSKVNKGELYDKTKTVAAQNKSKEVNLSGQVNSYRV